MKALSLSEEVAEALAAGRPIVALESSVIAQGLPRDVGPEAWRGWERAIRELGAVPATTAILGGRLAVGLSMDDIGRLADRSRGVAKAARRDLGPLAARGADAGTTVSATLALAHAAGIRVAATGGIGGVHRDFARLPDESADLRSLAELPVALCCAGAKAVLDVPATLERLESYSVPVLGYGTSSFPAFYTESTDPALLLSERVDGPVEAARALALHLALGGGGALLAIPPPKVAGLSAAIVEAAAVAAVEAAEKAGLRGKAVTPFLLAELIRLTGGLSLTANLGLLERNARVAAEVAVAWPVD